MIRAVDGSAAIVPIGISCQPAFQVEAHEPAIAKLFGTAVEKSATPFDWRIVGLGDIADMIAAGELFPGSADELTGNRRPHWPRRSCWFWHEKFAEFADFYAKQVHLERSWERLEDTRRKVFVASNVQNNLAKVRDSVGGFAIPIRFDDAIRLAGVLDRRFLGGVELHIVSRPDLLEGFDMLAGVKPGREIMAELDDHPVVVHYIGRDGSQWSGDLEAWGRVFRRAWER